MEKKKKKKTPMAHSDNKTTEEEEEEEAGWERVSSIFNNIREKSENENSAYRYGAN